MPYLQDFSLHNHTNLSDGCDTIKDIVTEAKKVGLKTLGITDHFYAIESNLQRYVKTIRMEQEKQQFPILLGAEIDNPSPDQLEKLYKIKHDFGFDFFIGALHVVPYNGHEYYVGDKNNTTITKQLDYQAKYWRTLPNLAGDLFDIIAHMDLIKLSGIKTEHLFYNEIDAALKAFKSNNQIIEINTKFSVTENQPSDNIVMKISQAGIPVIFSSDSHIKQKVNFRFQEEQNRLNAKFPDMRHISNTGDLLKFLRTRNHRLTH